ncbi:hypothetical protein [Bacterioplanoides sp.]|uniref:hypothetical protein n=1 Tax=Bacterioplanoides sp. TaxID=2066072 RepID=UPI003B5A983D
MKLRRIANEKPIEILSSILMIFAGVYLSSANQGESLTLVIGNALSAFGGALLSYATVSLTSKDTAAEMLSPQLSAIARQLVTVSGQISKAVHDARTGTLSESVALEMISQAARIMYASVNEIHVVLNQRVESQELLETAQKVEDLASQLAGGNGTNEKEVENELIDAIADLQSQVKAIAPSQNSSSKSTNNKNKVIPKTAPEDLELIYIECPDCRENTPIKIGKPYGASAMPNCSECGTRFHAHRKKDGSVLSKLQGQSETLA